MTLTVEKVAEIYDVQELLDWLNAGGVIADGQDWS